MGGELFASGIFTESTFAPSKVRYQLSLVNDNLKSPSQFYPLLEYTRMRSVQPQAQSLIKILFHITFAYGACT
jgi:hypothetical protein